MNAINHSEIVLTLLDGFSIFRAGLRRVLEAEPNLRVQFETADPTAALNHARTHLPHVVIVGANLRGVDCAQIVRALTTHARGVAVILLAPHLDEACRRAALNAGAFAALVGDVTTENLIATIHRAVRSETHLDASIRKANPDAPLSAREMQVLQYATYGKSNKEIAYLLKIKEKTVTNHMTSILQKMAAGNRTQAVVQGLRQGWIQFQTA